MKILITGGAGFIGSNLVQWILEQTDNFVVNVDNLTYAGNLESLKKVGHNDRYEFFRLDICDSAGIHKIVKRTRPDAIMHLAAESHVDRAINSPDQCMQTNILGTFNVLQATATYWSLLDAESRAAFRFLHVSTDEVYGSLEFEQVAFNEQTPYDPHSPYSASKAAADHLVRAWFWTYGLPVLTTICSNNYGPYQHPEKLIPTAILAAIHGQPIQLYGDGKNVRDWIRVQDHITALYAILTEGVPGETYAIGGANEWSNINLVREICGHLDELSPPVQNPLLKNCGVKALGSYSELITLVADRPGHDRRYAVDFGKLHRELGWKPGKSFESGLYETIKWYLTNRSWWEQLLPNPCETPEKSTVPPSAADGDPKR